MSIAIIPTISGSYEKGEKKETNRKIGDGIKTAMLISIPSAVGMAVLAKPVVYILYPQPESLEIVARLLQLMAASVIFYSLSTITNGVLQATGYVNKPMIHAAAALVLQTVLLTGLLLLTPMDIYAMALAAVFYSLCVSIFNGITIRRKLRYRQEMTKTFILPFVASLWMGAAAFLVYRGIDKIFLLLKLQQPGEMSWTLNCISLGISVVTAAVIYFILVIKLGAISKKELTAIPKGRILVKIAEKLHLC
jgi:stage V sporulation protein B